MLKKVYPNNSKKVLKHNYNVNHVSRPVKLHQQSKSRCIIRLLIAGKGKNECHFKHANQVKKENTQLLHPSRRFY